MRILNICLLLLATAAGSASADTRQDIEKCAAIRNAAERLFCFDNMAAELSGAGMSAMPAPAESAKNKPAATGRATAVTPPPAQEDSFGLEMEQVRDSADRIQSRYDGTFNGWDGATVFRLENGQVWKQAESGRLSMKAERPVITIKRGWFGAFYLKVEGANKSIRVKRVQ